MKMTYVDALNVAIATMTATEQDETTAKAIEKLEAMRTTYQNRSEKARTPVNQEKRDAIAAKRKEATAKARAELIATVAPILRKHLTADVTAKELFAKASAELPEGFTAAKVQNILIREMKPELVRTERKKGGDTYRLA
jgi:hypothetical protein